VRVEVAHEFPVPVDEGFAYITDLRNWPEYWPDFVRIRSESGEEPAWGSPGDRVNLVMRLLGREVELAMVLDRFEPTDRVGYRTKQRGLPDTRHERLFKGGDGRFTYTLIVDYDPRPALRGLFDRFLLPRIIRRALRRTALNLDSILRSRAGAPPA
jgi:hypothetical protein